jgi:hypothetical protein
MYNIVNLNQKEYFKMSRPFKLQVMVSDTLVSRIDSLCNITNCSRSAICSMILSMYITEFENQFNSSDFAKNTEDYQVIKLE